MPNPLVQSIVGNYYERGGSSSGVLGILNSMIKQREEQKTFGRDITKQLLGVEGVQRGLAKQSGLPYEEDPDRALARKRTELLNKQTEQGITGTSPTQARSFAASVLDDLQRDTTNLVLAIKRGMTKEQYVQSARTKLLDVYDILPESSRAYFDKAVSDLYESTSMAYGVIKKSEKKPSGGGLFGWGKKKEAAPKGNRYSVTEIP